MPRFVEILDNASGVTVPQMSQLIDPTVTQARALLNRPYAAPELPALLGSGIIGTPAVADASAAGLIPDWRTSLPEETSAFVPNLYDQGGSDVSADTTDYSPVGSGGFDASVAGVGQGVNLDMVDVGFALSNPSKAAQFLSPTLSAIGEHLVGPAILDQQIGAMGDVDDAIMAYSPQEGVNLVSDIHGNVVTVTTPQMVAEYDRATFGTHDPSDSVADMSADVGYSEETDPSLVGDNYTGRSNNWNSWGGSDSSGYGGTVSDSSGGAVGDSYGSSVGYGGESSFY